MKTVFMNFPRLGSIRINGVYNKGKKGNDKRIHITELSTNKDMVIWIEDHQIPGFGKEFEYTQVDIVKPGQLKQRNYNYYLDSSIDEDKFFDQMMNDYVNSDPMVPTSLTSYMHTKYSNSQKYPIYY